MEIPQHALDAAEVRADEQITVLNATKSEEYSSREEMTVTLSAKLFLDGVRPAEGTKVEALRWGWIEQPAARDSGQCMAAEPLGRLWVVYITK